MKNIPLLVGTILGTLILVIGAAMIFSNTSPVDEQGKVVVDETQAIGSARHSLGADPEASTSAQVVTIVEFSDFQCPACKVSQPAVAQVMQHHSDSVRLIFRHFPLDSIHPNARLAAQASVAVSELNSEQFWSFHDLLFENQQKWADIKDRDELKDTFAQYAEGLGIDKTQFLERMEDNSIAEIVTQDVSSGTQLGVTATPTFYVNGIKTTAPQLLATVESLLSNTK